MHNRTVPLVHNSRRYFGKFTSCTTFGGHKLVSSKPFLDCTKFYNCCQRYIATCGKNSYRCTSTFSALNYCGGIFFHIFQLSIRSGAHQLFRRFLEFSQFSTAIWRIAGRIFAKKWKNSTLGAAYPPRTPTCVKFSHGQADPCSPWPCRI